MSQDFQYIVFPQGQKARNKKERECVIGKEPGIPSNTLQPARCRLQAPDIDARLQARLVEAGILNAEGGVGRGCVARVPACAMIKTENDMRVLKQLEISAQLKQAPDLSWR